MTRCIALVFLVLLAATPAGARPKPPQPPTTESLIDHAKAAVRDGTEDPAPDLGPLIERLRTTSDESDQRHLIRTIEDLGRYDGANPAAVKSYLREAAPPALLTVARSKSASHIRGDALMALRSLNASDSVLDEAIAQAAADPDHQVQFSGRLLAEWKANRQGTGAAPPPATAGSSAKEKAALDLLRRQKRRVSAQTLGEAALDAETEVIAALLDTGLDANVQVLTGLRPLDYATGMGCVGSEASVEERLATVDLLIQRGADVKVKDAGGNTILMTALDCPAPVIEKLIAAGANVTAANSQGFSPLALAFAKGRWDVAAILVAHGGRLSKKMIDKLFFEMPTDPGKLALIHRATATTAAVKK